MRPSSATKPASAMTDVLAQLSARWVPEASKRGEIAPTGLKLVFLLSLPAEVVPNRACRGSLADKTARPSQCICSQQNEVQPVRSSGRAGKCHHVGGCNEEFQVNRAQPLYALRGGIGGCAMSRSRLRPSHRTSGAESGDQLAIIVTGSRIQNNGYQRADPGHRVRHRDDRQSRHRQRRRHHRTDPAEHRLPVRRRRGHHRRLRRRRVLCQPSRPQPCGRHAHAHARQLAPLRARPRTAARSIST